MTLHRSFVLLPLLVVIFSALLAGCRSSEELTHPDDAEVGEVVDETEESDEIHPDEIVEPDTEELQERFTPPPTDPDAVPAPMEEFRGVWVATVANIDWPSKPGLPVSQQKEEMIELLDRAASLHFNAVIFQVRPSADAFYASPYEPWSYYLNGKMGQSPLPEYDPLEFAIEEAHKRGLALHAWFNPYRASHFAANGDISPDHISRTHPDYVVKYGNHLWLDPGNEQVREYTLNVILDVVERYDIDGVHIDDYFYPYPDYANGADFPDDKSWSIAQNSGNRLSRADWRRENVNKLINELSVSIKEIKPDVKFGISPFGIWRPGYPENTTGFDAYENLYADARLWLNEGWLDYFTPQLYYRIEQTPQPFPVMLEWWASQNRHHRHLWPGLFTSRLHTVENLWPPEEITGQVFITRGFPDVTGAVHFSMNAFLKNSQGFNRRVSSGPYAFPSLLPATPWLGNTLPDAPDLVFSDHGDAYTLQLDHNADESIRWWVIQKRFGTGWMYDVVPATLRELRYEGGSAMIRPDEVQISAVDKTGMKSEPAIYVAAVHVESSLDSLATEIVRRDQWADKKPVGRELQGIRQHLATADTLRFLDMNMVSKGMIRSAKLPVHLLKDPQSGSQEPYESVELVRFQMIKNSVSDEIQAVKGEAFNWYGYHIAVLDLDFSSGIVELEIVPATMMSVDGAAQQSAGESQNRIKIPHNLEKIRLHHAILTEEQGHPVDSLNGLVSQTLEEEKWWDIPWHFIISSDGTIYEGRYLQYAGDTNLLYDPRGTLQIGVTRAEENSSLTQEQIESVGSLTIDLIQEFNMTNCDFDSFTDEPGVSLSDEYRRKRDHRAVVRDIQERLGSGLMLRNIDCNL